ncbi:peroxiredoxin [Candidatus Haliotispira prima]|uniref:thioredoxin-dependent peroxiredoxin n=1 Tax=Candidatus Haliotispira prima TaxID=3034016 RepID=A0ABY8MJV0_9SPIO|nr:peroxiredoxin [Candidatus Haliotispira prima]
MKLEKGQKAPDFSLQGSDGKTHTLADFGEKRLVLYFYPKDDTPGCTTEALDFTEYVPQFAAQNTVIAGVSPDSPETHQSFIAKHGLGILLLADPDKTCIEAYGAWGEKKNYGKVYEGLIRSTILIDAKGVVEKIYYNVKAKDHAERVLRELPAS